MNQSSPRGPSRASLIEAMEAVCQAGGLRRVVHANGPVDEHTTPADATVSRSPRLVITIGGENHMLVPTEDGVVETILRPWEAVFISQRSWNHVLRKAPFYFITLDYKSDLVRYYCREHTFTDSREGHYAVYYKHGAPSSVVGHMVRAMEAMSPDRREFDDAVQLGNCLFNQTLVDLKASRQTASKAQLSYQHAVDYISENLDTDLSRHAVAEACGLHPNHLSRLFRDRGQDSFNSYVTRERMAVAERMVGQSAVPIKAVAARLGYQDLSYFSAVFRKHHGLSPGKYRQKLDM